MKTRCLVLGLVLAAQFVAGPRILGQVSSPRRLTQRIAPLLPPQPTNAPRPAPAVPPPAQGGVQPAAPDRSTRDVTNVNATEPQKAPGNEDASGKSPAEAAITSSPVLVQPGPVKIDPDRSLQFIDLTLTNTCPKAITKITLHLTYLDTNGSILKDWTTYRELDRPLPPNSVLELNQPAYFMPLVTKRVEVKAEEVRFADGTEWPPGPMASPAGKTEAGK